VEARKAVYGLEEVREEGEKEWGKMARRFFGLNLDKLSPMVATGIVVFSTLFFHLLYAFAQERAFKVKKVSFYWFFVVIQGAVYILCGKIEDAINGRRPSSMSLSELQSYFNRFVSFSSMKDNFLFAIPPIWLCSGRVE